MSDDQSVIDTQPTNDESQATQEEVNPEDTVKGACSESCSECLCCCSACYSCCCSGCTIMGCIAETVSNVIFCRFLL